MSELLIGRYKYPHSPPASHVIVDPFISLYASNPPSPFDDTLFSYPTVILASPTL